MIYEPQTYTVADIQKILRISRTAAYTLVNNPPFDVIRIGQAIRIVRRSFDTWLTGIS